MNTLRDCRITMDGQVDTSSIASIVRDVTAPLGSDAGDEAKVLALFRWARNHLFAFPASPGDLHEDFNKALQIINWYGYGLCGTQAKVLGMLAAHLLGHENVRLIGMREREPGSWRMEERGPRAFIWSKPGWARDIRPFGGQGHTSLEIRWDGRWHFLDMLVGLYRRDPSGRIVGIDEIIADPNLVTTPVGDRDGDMPYGPEPEIFTESTVTYREIHCNTWPGRPLPLNLRPGERFTWLAERIPGAYYLHAKRRQRYGSHILAAPGPRGHAPDRPVPYWGNGEHRYDVTLRPDASDPHWCPESADWHVSVELPYPVIRIHWEMAEGGTGFLHHRPTTGDEIIPITAVGSAYQPECRGVACGYWIIVRAPDRTGPTRLSLRTIVQLNPAVTPKVGPGRNVVRLSAEGDGLLAARLDYRVGDEATSADLTGLGEHTLTLPDIEAITPGGICLANVAE